MSKGWYGHRHQHSLASRGISTRQMKADIAKRKFRGWDDPRLDTLASLKKRGYKPEAFWKIAEHIGISEVDKVIDKKDFFEILDRFNC